MIVHKKQTGYTITDAEARYIEARLPQIEKLLTTPAAAKVDIEIAKEEHGATPFYAEITIEDNGKLFRTSSEAVSAEVAFEEAKEGILRELREKKHKDNKDRKKLGAKLKDMFRFGGDK